MKKYPAFQFYPGDWLQDTRALSLSAKGAWIDFLCAMWHSQSRGMLSLTLVGYSRLIGATVEQTKAVITELVDLGICETINGRDKDVTDCNEKVTLINRRMIREEKQRENNRLRVKRHRKKTHEAECNENVTLHSSSSYTCNAEALHSVSSLPDRAVNELPPAVLSIPLIKRDGEFGIRQQDIEEWRETYPGVDVINCLKRIRQWNRDNPRRRKTRNGIRSHISKWLDREQNKSPGKYGGIAGRDPHICSDCKKSAKIIIDGLCDDCRKKYE